MQTNFRRISLDSLGALWCLYLPTNLHQPAHFWRRGFFILFFLNMPTMPWKAFLRRLIKLLCPTFHKINYIKQPLTLLKVWQYFGSIQSFAGRKSLGLLYPYRIMNCVVALVSKSVPCIMGKCIVISGILLRFQVAGKHNKQAGNKTVRNFFWFYFSSNLTWT